MRYRLPVLAWTYSVLFLAVLFSPYRAAQASTYLELDDEAYTLLSRLEAEGVITSGLLATRPISRQEAMRLLREAETNAAERGPFVQGIISELQRRVSPISPDAAEPVQGSVYASYVWARDPRTDLSFPGASRETRQVLTYNHDGDLYDLGSNGRAGFTARAEDLGPLSVYLNPEVRSSDEGTQAVLRTGYVVLGFSWIDIVAGKDSQWWGPGYHGALLLSDNAAPPPMIKVTAPEPLILPWFLKYLGPFQYVMFLSQLEEDRTDFPRPFFWGMRLSFKPHRSVEIGLERTALMGGSGRPLNTRLVLQSIFGSREQTTGQDPGDQRAGFDVTVTLPFKSQPMQLYWERAGEENRQRNLRWPYKLANLYGVYLPRLLGLERVGVRAEYASDHVNEQPDVWYTHGAYTAGYTYDGMIIGHHMGTDAKDRFVELSCLVPEHHAQLFLSYDKETHNVEGPVRETTSAVAARARISLTRQTAVTVTGGMGRVENPGMRPGVDRTVGKASLEVRYEF